MKSFFSFLLGFSMFCLSMSQSKALRKNISQSDPLGAGDLIFIKNSAHSSLNKRFLLSEKGEIKVPLAGRIKLSGHSPYQASKILRTRLRTYYVGIEKIRVIVKKRQKYIWVKGWVKQPGRYIMDYRDGMEQLLVLSKGGRQGARLDQIWIHVPGKQPKQFNLLKYYQNNGSVGAPELERNTLIFVPISKDASPEIGLQPQGYYPGESRIAVFGSVHSPGVFRIAKELNLLQALALAKGPNLQAGIEEILITSPKGTTTWFNLKKYWKLKSTETPLPKILSGSVIYVPQTPIVLHSKPSMSVVGQVSRTGKFLGNAEDNIVGWLTRSGGPVANADLENVNLVYKGSNFTIHQRVNVQSAVQRGQFKKLLSSHKGEMVLFVPERQPISQRVQNIQTTLSILVSATTIVSTVALMFVLFPPEQGQTVAP